VDFVDLHRSLEQFAIEDVNRREREDRAKGFGEADALDLELRLKDIRDFREDQVGQQQVLIRAHTSICSLLTFRRR